MIAFVLTFSVGPKVVQATLTIYVPLVHPHEVVNVDTGGILSKVSLCKQTEQQARTAVMQDQSEQELHNYTTSC